MHDKMHAYFGMKVLLCQLDGSLPNLALMRISAQRKAEGAEVELRHGAQFEAELFSSHEPDQVYGAAIFRKTIPLAERLKRRFPTAIIGGTGVDPARKGEIVPLSPIISQSITAIENHGFAGGETANDLDYSLYPNYSASLGFTQRGCTLACSFCCVGVKEGRNRGVQSVYDLWRGDQHPRHLHLLDNDLFGQSDWRARVDEIRNGGFKVSFNQGINSRFLTEEAAEAVASMDYRDDSMKVKRVYTAWDNLRDEERLFAGLNRLLKYGVKPDHIMVYLLVGYWPGETTEERLYRIRRILDFGARPYPMPFVRTPELVGLQRWAIGAYAKFVPWETWVAAKYQPKNIRVTAKEQMMLEVIDYESRTEDDTTAGDLL